MEYNTKKTAAKKEHIKSVVNDLIFPVLAIQHSTFNIQHSARRAFTLIETLVAIAILLIAVVGPISLIGNAIHNLYYAKDEMIAIHLAQEGIEVVRQVRDSNMLDGGIPWDSWIASGNYIINVNSLDTPVVAYGGGTDPQPVYVDVQGLYNQSGGTATQFKRMVTTSNVDIGRQIKVMSTVTWTTGGQIGSVIATDYLFKWAI